MGRRSDTTDDEADDASVVSKSDDNHDDSRRRSRKDKKKKKKSSKKRKSSSRRDDHDRGSSSGKRSSSKKSKKRRYNSSDDESSASDDDDESSRDSDSEYEKKKSRRSKKKRGRKEDKKAHKKKKKKSKKRCSRSDDEDDEELRRLERNYQLADALIDLLEQHPPMGSDLPVILVRLASGTTFNLSQMQPASAARGLAQVLQCLAPFGVTLEKSTWEWKSPDGAASHTNTNELVLVRIVRAMLDQIGITLDAIEAFENPKIIATPQQAATTNTLVQGKASTTSTMAAAAESIEERVKRILDTFEKTNNTLSGELAGLCQMIMEGESIALDGLPDETLRTALEGLLDSCGLEKVEMDQEEEDEEESEKVPTMGYSLPENNDDTSPSAAQQCLSRIVAICKTVAARPSRVLGPKRPPTNYDPSSMAAAALSDDDEDDEGPSIVPRAQKNTQAVDLKAQAARRQRELSHVAAGQGPLPADYDEDGREEWMLTPGKSDFFDFIKTGQPMKSRKFQGKAKGGDDNEQVMDPSVQAELDAIKKAHHSARGPSLMAEHQEAKKAKAAEAAQNKEKGGTQWNWKRDQDLDAGRRVDKDALQMVLGGAASGLQSKFQGGFHGAR